MAEAEKAISRERMEEWEARERTITMTNAQWNDLALYLFITERKRWTELEYWQDVARTTQNAETAKMAQRNADLWASLIKSMELIGQKLDRTRGE